MNKHIIPIVIPYLNQKNDWLLNSQDYINKNGIDITKEYAKKNIEEHLQKINEEDEVEIVFYGMNIEKKELLEVAYEYVKAGKVKNIRISTIPNYINREFLSILKKYKIKIIELEIQTTNDYILKKIGMNYNFQDIKKASRLIRLYGFKLGHQMTIGLPESTKIDDINTARNIIKLKPKIVSITPVLVIKDTLLEKEYKEERYKPLTLVQSVEVCEEIVSMFTERKVDTIAIGYGILDNDLEQLHIAKKIIDGPFHPSFRELVETNLWYTAIVNKIKKLNMKVNQVEVTVNPLDTNNVIGYKQENIIKLKELYNVELIVVSNENIKQGKSKIQVTKEYKDFVEI